MGIKHNAVGLIYSFKQKDQEIVRDCVNKLKQYIARCPKVEKPSQTRLVSIFLESLRNKTLHAHLYAKKHSTFNACCMDAMDYDDNCELSTHDNTEGRVEGTSSVKKGSESNSSAPSINPDQIADLVLKKLGQTYRPQYRQSNYTPNMQQGPYKCGTCGGPHRMDQC